MLVGGQTSFEFFGFIVLQAFIDDGFKDVVSISVEEDGVGKFGSQTLQPGLQGDIESYGVIVHLFGAFPRLAPLRQD